jgi:hypothetical protein
MDPGVRRDDGCIWSSAVPITVIASEAKQSRAAKEAWIASSLRSSQ